MSFTGKLFLLLLSLHLYSLKTLGQHPPPIAGTIKQNTHRDSSQHTIKVLLSQSPPYQGQIRNQNSSTETFFQASALGSPSNSSVAKTLSMAGAINISVTVKGSTCGYSNGSIVAVASGGTPPYSYDLGTGRAYQSGYFPLVQPGTYKLTVTDAAGQSASTNVTLENTYPKVAVKALSYQVASGCAVADASVTLEGSGGTPPYEFSMDGVHYQSSNTFTNFYSGLYYFFIRDANGCIAALNAFDLSSFINGSCNATGFSYSMYACTNNGEISITGFGPNKPYTYSIDGVHYQTSGDFKNLSSGMYPMHFKDATGTIQIVVVPIYQSCNIIIKYISVDAACGKSDGTLTVTASNGTPPYLYTINGINYQSSNEFTGLVPGMYNITVRDAQGFTNSLTAFVYDRCPTVSVSTTDETCAKNDGTITATPDKGTPPYQYSLDGVHFQSNNLFSALKADSYAIMLRDANGFTSTATATINYTCINVSAQSVDATCGNPNGRITVAVTNGTAPYLYSIDGINFQPTATFDNLAAGTYTFTVKDGTGKLGKATVKIFDMPAPNMKVIVMPTSCRDDDGFLTIKATEGTRPFMYSIEGTNFQTDSTFKGLKSGSYTVFIKDGNGCIVSKPIIIHTNCPLVTAVVKDETCGSKNGTITVSGSNGVPPYQYSIDGTDFKTSPVFSALSSGNYTITIKDAVGVINTTSVEVTNICPVATATVINGKCVENSGVLTVQASQGYAPYQYSLDGLTYQQSNVFINVASGTYMVFVKDNLGLIARTTATVQNSLAPKVTVSTTAATCLNNDGKINVGIIEGVTPFSFSINNNAFQSTSVFNKLSAGTYNVAVKDSNGCTNTQKGEVALTNNLTLQVNREIAVCEGTSVQLHVASNAATFRWSPPTDIRNATDQNPSVSPHQPTTYIITATLGICSRKDSVRVRVNPAPIAVAYRDTTICYGQSVRLSGEGGTNYKWSPAVYLSNTTSPTPVVQTPQSSTTYSLKVTDEKGCASLNPADVNVRVTPPAKLFAGNDTAIVMNQPFQLVAQDANNSGFAQYSWRPADGLSNSHVQNPVVTLNHDMAYSVTAATQAGCKGEDEIVIKVYQGPEIFVPTAFTPNQDGRNDVLKPTPVGIKEFKYFAVYNRYGERVFYSTILNNGWNGTYKGLPQSTGAFVWLTEGLDDKGNLIRRKGTVILIR